MGAKKLEELIAWQLAHEFTRDEGTREAALKLADRAMACVVSLKTSLEPYVAKRSEAAKKGRGPGT